MTALSFSSDPVALHLQGSRNVVIHLFERADIVASWKGGPMSSPEFGSESWFLLICENSCSNLIAISPSCSAEVICGPRDLSPSPSSADTSEGVISTGRWPLIAMKLRQLPE